MLVLGAFGSFLEPFWGHLLPKVENIYFKTTLTYPHEGPCVGQHAGPNPLYHRGHGTPHKLKRDFFIDNLLDRIHFIIVMIRWTCLARWEFEFPFPGSLFLPS